MKVAVVGTGAMGSVYAGLLAAAGNEVWAIDPWVEHIEAIRTNGLRVEGASGDRVVSVRASTSPDEAGLCDLVVLATKAMHVEAAAAGATSLVGPDTVVLTIQNGLGSADRVARILGSERLAVGIAGGFGASLEAPGHVRHEGWELVRIGEYGAPATDRIRRVADTWREAGFRVEVEDDIQRAIWEKLVCNAAFSGVCVLLECRLRDVLDAAGRVERRRSVCHGGRGGSPVARDTALVRGRARSRARLRRAHPRRTPLDPAGLSRRAPERDRRAERRDPATGQPGGRRHSCARRRRCSPRRCAGAPCYAGWNSLCVMSRATSAA